MEVPFSKWINDQQSQICFFSISSFLKKSCYFSFFVLSPYSNWMQEKQHFIWKCLFFQCFNTVEPHIGLLLTRPWSILFMFNEFFLSYGCFWQDIQPPWTICKSKLSFQTTLLHRAWKLWRWMSWLIKKFQKAIL